MYRGYDPLVDVRDREDMRENYLDSVPSRKRPVHRASHVPPPSLKTLGFGGGCWCGEQYGHDWPGKESGEPHPKVQLGNER